MSNEKRAPAVMSHALKVPGLNKLHGKRVILASASPRRKQILETFVRIIHTPPSHSRYISDVQNTREYRQR